MAADRDIDHYIEISQMYRRQADASQAEVHALRKAIAQKVLAGELAAGDPAEPITEDWLRENGFRVVGNRNDDRLPVRRLVVGHDGVEGRQPFTSPDDLCIDVSPGAMDGCWYCWIFQAEPYRHIHVRHMRWTWELKRLYEGLTGLGWDQRRRYAPPVDKVEAWPERR